MARRGEEPHARAEMIIQHLEKVGTSSPAELAERFGVSMMTMHRDLTSLAEQGLVIKEWGRVSIQRTQALESSAKFRSSTAVEEKRAMAAAAHRLIHPGATILLDDSTSAGFIARTLDASTHLTVTTNFLPVINGLTHRSGVALNVIGGQYNHSHESFMGSTAIDMIRSLRVGTAFVSTTTLNADGLFHQEDFILLMKREMIAIADRVVVLADPTKFGPPSLHRICGWEAIDDLITTPGAPTDTLEAIRRQGVSVITAGNGVEVAESDPEPAPEEAGDEARCD